MIKIPETNYKDALHLKERLENRASICNLLADNEPKVPEVSLREGG
jgi:hypothetical protein